MPQLYSSPLFAGTSLALAAGPAPLAAESAQSPDMSADEDEYNDAYNDDDEYISSSPSISGESDIDFTLVYAFHTFKATQSGHADATKGDQMILLDDSNEYWWLVRLVKDSSIGYLPAENIEMPAERLARLNKHRNADLAPDAPDPAEERTRNPIKRLKSKHRDKDRVTKLVSFTDPTFYDPPEGYFLSDSDTDDQDEDDDLDEQEDEPDMNELKEEPHEDENELKEEAPEEHEDTEITLTECVVGVREIDPDASNLDSSFESVKLIQESLHIDADELDDILESDVPTSDTGEQNLRGHADDEFHEQARQEPELARAQAFTQPRDVSSEHDEHTDVLHELMPPPDSCMPPTRTAKRNNLLKTKSSLDKLSLRYRLNSGMSSLFKKKHADTKDDIDTTPDAVAWRQDKTNSVYSDASTAIMQPFAAYALDTDSVEDHSSDSDSGSSRSSPPPRFDLKQPPHVLLDAVSCRLDALLEEFWSVRGYNVN